MFLIRRHTVRSSNDHVKVIAPLSGIDSCFGRDGAAPQDTLDDCSTSRVGAGVGRNYRGIPLKDCRWCWQMLMLLGEELTEIE